MATSVIGTLVINIIASTAGLARGMARASSSMLGMNAGAGKLTAGLFGLSSAFFGVGGAALAFGVTMRKMISTTREFNKNFAASTAIMEDLTAAQAAGLEKAARNVSKTTKFTAAEAAASLRTLASAGLNAEQTMNTIGVAARFAQAGLMDLDVATEQLVRVQGAMGLKVADAGENMKNMQHVADLLTKANDLAVGKVEDFAFALTNKAGPMARNFGKDLEETLSVLMAFAEQGVVGEEAGTAFAIVLRDLSTKALKNADVFRMAGVEVYDPVTGKLNHMKDIIKDLEVSLSGLTDAEKKETLMLMGFQDRSVNFLLNLIGTGDRIEEFYDKLTDGVSGYSDEVSNRTLPAFEQSMERMKAGWETFSDAVVDSDVYRNLGLFVDSIGTELEQTGKNINKKGFWSGIFSGRGGHEESIFSEGWRWLTGKMPKEGPIGPNAKLTEAQKRLANMQFGVGGDAFARNAAMSQFMNYSISSAGAVEQMAEHGKTVMAQLKEDKEYWDEIEDMVKGIQADMKALGQAMQQQMKDAQSPAEQYIDKMLQLELALKKNIISLDMFKRLSKEAADKLKESVKAKDQLNAQGTGAMLAGTTGAFSAVQSSRREMAASTTKLVDLQARQNKLTEDTNKKLEDIKKNGKGAGDIIFNQVSF